MTSKTRAEVVKYLEWRLSPACDRDPEYVILNRKSLALLTGRKASDFPEACRVPRERILSYLKPHYRLHFRGMGRKQLWWVTRVVELEEWKWAYHWSSRGAIEAVTQEPRTA